MFNYAKNILTAVSFDNDLFRKEFIKMSAWVSPEEATNLLVWCKETFNVDFLMKAGLM